MKKGFTLIELLAVIVILAIIALIATPIIINIIEDSRKSAAIQSANGYVRAVNYKIAQEALHNTVVADDEYIIGENELAITGNNIDGITGSYTISESRVLFAGLCVNNFSIEYNSLTGHTGISTASNYCTGDTLPEYVEPEGEYISAACTDSSLYADTTVFKIKTVEDLVCLSNLVNSGSTFDDKTVYLVSDLDFNSNDSYSNINTTSYGDINGDNSTDGLKTEVTTGKGFKPIGNSTYAFAGTFEGYAFTISNIMINRPSDTYVGIFGNSSGVLTGVKLRNVNITGGNNTGSLAGKASNTIKNIDVTGTIIGAATVGGIAGRGTPLALNNSVFKGTVRGTNTAAGLVGYIECNSMITGAVYDSIIQTDNSTASETVSSACNNFNRGTSVVYNTQLVKNGTPTQVQLMTKNYLGVADIVLDTYIGGDNDEDKYYFDYNSDGEIEVYSTERTPIKYNKLKGSGTSESPYIIKNTEDWRIATATIDEDEPKYYALTVDLDFSNKNYYSMGTNANIFNGNIDGNMHTISNVAIEGLGNAGLFINSSGTIQGIKLNNVTSTNFGKCGGGLVGTNSGTITGIKTETVTVVGNNDKTGGLAGCSSGTIQDIDFSGSVTGTKTVGGIVGRGEPVTVNNALFKGTITGSNEVGGIVGSIACDSAVSGVVYAATITSDNSSAREFAGSACNNFNVGTTLIYNSSLVKSGTSTPTQTLTKNYLGVIDTVLDTYIGGDNDGTDYYFDYDNSGEIVLYSVKETPITNTLSGSGTEASPYLIANTNDWRIATSTIDEDEPKYYKLTADLSFDGVNNYYSMGTISNVFNGNFNGDKHTISDVTLEGFGTAGVFMKSSGTIQKLNLTDIAVTSKGTCGGSLVGENLGTILGVKVRNSNITTTDSKVGGLVGCSSGPVKSIDVQATVTGGSIVGGVVGIGTGGSINNVLFSGNVTGTNVVAGGVASVRCTVGNSGVVHDSTITSDNTSAREFVGEYCNYFDTGATSVFNNTLVKQGTSTAMETYSGDLITKVSSTLDTTDSDSDGLYFGLVNNELTLIMN